MKKEDVFNYVVSDIQEDVQKDILSDSGNLKQIIETRAMWSIVKFLQDKWTMWDITARINFMNEISEKVINHFYVKKN